MLNVDPKLLANTDLEALVTAIDGRFWGVEKRLKLRTIALDSIENCKQVCEGIANPEDIFFQQARQRWVELSQAEVEKAMTMVAAKKAYKRIPRNHRDDVLVEDDSLSQAAVERVVSLEKSVEKILAFLKEDRGYSYSSFSSLVILEQMFEVARNTLDFALTWEKFEEDNKLSFKGRELKQKVRAKVEAGVRQDAVAKNLSELHQAAEAMPYRLQELCFRISLEVASFGEDELRKFVEKLSRARKYGDRPCMYETFAEGKLDELTLQKVQETVTTCDQAKDLLKKYSGHQTRALLQEIIDQSLREVELTFETAAEICRRNSGHRNREQAWHYLRGQIKSATLEQVKILWELKSDRQEVGERFLELAGSDVALLDELCEFTHSPNLLLKRLEYPMTHEEGLKYWRATESYKNSWAPIELDLEIEVFMRYVVTTMDSFREGLRFLKSLGSRSSKNRNLRVLVLERLLEIAKDDMDNILMIPEALERDALTQEMQDMIVIALLPFFPREAVEVEKMLV